MRSPLRILFIGYFQYNCGSAHALLGYARAAERLGCTLRASMLGFVDDIVKLKVPVADADWTPDLVALIFESKQFLNPLALARIEQLVPRSRRLVIDPDGKYSEAIQVGTDTNHSTPQSHEFWSELYQRLSDRVLQPCLGAVAQRATRFLYFGIDLHRPRVPEAKGEKPYGMIYVGNNWYRWHDFVWLFEQLGRIRPRLGRVAVFGKHWLGDAKPGLEEHTYSDPNFLKTHGVESHRSVPFDDVERVMGRGKLHPIFIRPVLNMLGLATPRMFETFAADTVPILPPYFDRAVTLYGARVTPLCLPESPADAVEGILDRYPDYLALSREIRATLTKEHSYESRLAELLGLFA